MEKTIDNYYRVGEITKDMADIAQLKFNGFVYAAPGVIKHIKKRHKSGESALSPQVISDIIPTIEKIILKPDYIGKHPSKIGTSMELVKRIDDNILVALEVDLDCEYIYVSSMYPVTEGKIKTRLNSGRFIKSSNIELDEVAVDKDIIL